MASQDKRIQAEPKDPVEAALHDLTNVLSAARSYADVLLLRSKSAKDPGVAEALMRELERASEILRNVRRETYRAGDVLACQACGYTFVFRKASGTRAVCRRCGQTEVERWKP